MAGLVKAEAYDEMIVNICPNGTSGEVINIDGLYIQLPEQPPHEQILYHKLPQEQQRWERHEPSNELIRLKSMDDWAQSPKEFRAKHSAYISEEYRRRKEGLWFYNNGIPTYITGSHYMLLQWTKIDASFYGYYLDFQRKLFIHAQACEVDPRSVGQLFVKCRRSGYTNIAVSKLLTEGTLVKDKVLGVMSKTGKDAQDNIFMKKVVGMYRHYPFFFKPIQDGTTNPRMELAFREPAKRITKTNKSATAGEALNTIINWRNTVNNAYDGERLYYLFLDEAGKWEKPADIREAWRINRTCLIVGRKIVGTALVGSTVNPMDKGGSQYKDLWFDSDPEERNANGRTRSMLYRIFIPAYEALEGFFDKYGNPIIEDPEQPVETIDGDFVSIGARTYLNNERDALKEDANELNEVIRQFPFSPEEAFRDSVDSSIFNIGKIYEQIQHNDMMYPSPVVIGNFHWKNGEKDTEVIFEPNPEGRWHLAWMPPQEVRNQKTTHRNGHYTAPNTHIGVGGVDSYDLDGTVDGRGSKGACHFYNKFNMNYPANMFVAEYASRPPLAKIFYEDVLMAAVFFGYPILIENNKYGIARYFEQRGYLEYLLDRPKHLMTSHSNKSKTKGVPSNGADLLQAHAQSIEAYIHNHVGENHETGTLGKMYFNRTLEDWIGFRIDKRTKYDLTISSGLCLLASQTPHKEVKKTDFSKKKFLRRYRPNA
eukprot:GHVN01046256.1.p1 GENE.GHVN01046256.1~~GHVN01046256.1.p1  ORF type:complete len:709 (+),score=32.69 GHVN01046256.1:298-2424(+)